MRVDTENVRIRPESTVSSAPGAMIALVHRGLSAGDRTQPLAALALGRDARHHRGEAAPQPHREAEEVEEQPEADHEVVAERMALSIGWRPAKPESISCQWVIRSSPRRQQRKIGRSSRRE